MLISPCLEGSGDIVAELVYCQFKLVAGLGLM